MDASVELAVQRAIRTMNQNLGEQLTVDDLARAAMFSKFHFTRVFQRVTGVSPGRFLSALRLQRAKHLLVSTSLNVADISLLVGYNSVGTFSSRFSRSVGMPPTVYRRRAGFASDIRTRANGATRPPGSARLFGQIRYGDEQAEATVFLGLFPERIPEGQPVCCTILPRPGRYQFTAVPQGTWYLLAQAVTGDPERPAGAAGGEDRPVSVATCGPLTVRRDSTVRADLTLQPAQAMDPPVLLALLDARKLALARAEEQRAEVRSIQRSANLVGSGRTAA